MNADGNMPYDICEDDLTLDFIEGEMARRGKKILNYHLSMKISAETLKLHNFLYVNRINCIKCFLVSI